MAMLSTDAALDALRAFGVEAARRPVRLQRGSLNQNYRVEVSTGRLFLRRHRPELTRAAIEREHAIVRWVAARGIPAPLPFATPSGETVLQIEGACWALFPWVEGRSVVRGRIPLASARALGDLNGEVHAVLADHPEAPPKEWRITWDTAEAFDTLERLELLVAARGGPDDVLEGIRFRLRLLESGEARPVEAFREMPVQLVHGDFHDKQVVFGRGSEVRALVDWEMAGWLPRTWEVIRSLVFSKLIDGPGFDAYMEGYAGHVRLSPEECRLGVELWWQTRLHETWALRTYFFENNARVARFVGDGLRHVQWLADPSVRAALAARLARVR